MGTDTYAAAATDQDALLRLLELTWADVHHSRNQDWQFWVGLAGVAAGLGGVAGRETVQFVVPYLLALGAAIALVGAIVSWSHWELHCKKMAYITRLEMLIGRSLGGEAEKLLPYYGVYDTPKGQIQPHLDKWVVSGVIFSFYCATAISLLLGLFLCPSTWDVALGAASAALWRMPAVFLGVGAASFLGSYFLSKSVMAKKREAYLKRCRALVPDA